jgi:hypothetical protein
MPRRSKGARLWLRRRRGRAAIWVILDHGREINTDAGEDDIGAAENALAEYIDLKRRPDFSDGHPAKILIADALAEYGERHAPTTRGPDLIGAAIINSSIFFGDRTVATVTNSMCSSYVGWRVSQTDARRRAARSSGLAGDRKKRPQGLSGPVLALTEAKGIPTYSVGNSRTEPPARRSPNEWPFAWRVKRRGRGTAHVHHQRRAALPANAATYWTGSRRSFALLTQNPPRACGLRRAPLRHHRPWQAPASPHVHAI